MPSPAEDTVLSMVLDGDSLWIATAAGLRRLRISRGIVEKINNEHVGFKAGPYGPVVAKAAGRIWFSPPWGRTAAGIYCLGEDRQEWKCVVPNTSGYCYTESGDLVWIGTPEGLLRYNTRTDREKLFTTRDGLVANHVTSVAVDDRFIWVGTTSGISRLDKTALETLQSPPCKGSNTIRCAPRSAEGQAVRTGAQKAKGPGLSRTLEMIMANRQCVTRRAFLSSTATATAAAWAAPSIVPASALGADGKVAPSNRIAVGMIGVGRQAYLVNMKQFFAMPEVQILAVCDVDSWRLANAKQAVEDHYAKGSSSGKFKGCATYGDFRKLLARKDLDAVMISTPDHWHTPIAIAAAEAGKDVSLEKPITRTIAEGRALVDAMSKHRRVFRVDSEFRSRENFHRICELVRNGRIGELRTIEVGVPAGDDVTCPPCPEMPVPKELDYEKWLGPAPPAPYTVNRVHPPRGYGRPGWMRHLDYCDGMITNWGAHLCDIVQWGNGSERTGPVEVEGHGRYPPPESFWNVLKTFEVRYRFADGVRVVYKTEKAYVRFEGSKGWIYGEYPRGLKAQPASVLDSKIGPDEIHFPRKSDKQDFIDAVKTRGQTLEDAEVGHRTTSLCHLGHIAIQVGGRLRWDPDKERFIDNPPADRLIDTPIRTPRHS